VIIYFILRKNFLDFLFKNLLIRVLTRLDLLNFLPHLISGSTLDLNSLKLNFFPFLLFNIFLRLLLVTLLNNFLHAFFDILKFFSFFWSFLDSLNLGLPSFPYPQLLQLSLLDSDELIILIISKIFIYCRNEKWKIKKKFKVLVYYPRNGS